MVHLSTRDSAVSAASSGASHEQRRVLLSLRELFLERFLQAPNAFSPGPGTGPDDPGTAPRPGSGEVGDQRRDPCHVPVTGCPWWAPKTKDGNGGSTESEGERLLVVGGGPRGGAAWRGEPWREVAHPWQGHASFQEFSPSWPHSPVQVGWPSPADRDHGVGWS